MHIIQNRLGDIREVLLTINSMDLVDNTLLMVIVTKDCIKMICHKEKEFIVGQTDPFTKVSLYKV